jgi:HAE1 family hydrophobic/amphiphilic exporter-1
VSASLDGVREVWGAVLAATVTTIAVFIPILLIQEEAGQLFRDIALAICAAVGLSLIVSVTVIPTCAARLLKHAYHGEARPPRELPRGTMRVLMMPVNAVRRLSQVLHEVPDRLGRMIYWVCGSVLARVVIVAVLTAASLIGSSLLMPPADYLPAGNRNLIFGMIIPPPGYNLEQRLSVARRAEETIRPYWEAGQLEPGSSAARAAAAALPSVPTFDWMRGAPGDPIVPPPVDNYFSVAFGDIMFQGGVSADPARVVDLQPLFQHATRAESIPGVLAFAFQVPLFRLGGSTGSAIKIDLMGDDLDEVTACTSTMYRLLSDSYGRQNIQPSPSNFNIFGPELQVIPDRHRLADLGMSPSDLAIAVQANGDGAIIGEYRQGGDTIDLKLLASDAVDRRAVVGLEDVPVATPSGHVVPLASLSQFRRTTSAPQINHAGRQRSVTLMFTPPQGLPLEQAVMEVDQLVADLRADGTISPRVDVDFTGSASKLASVQSALLGDGTVLGTLNSSLVLSLIVVYLLLCVLFQSFLRPLVIMFSVPLALLGGFAALFAVFIWSVTDRYLPVQTMDVLTMLGFVILIGVVVNNAILIVHQALNFMRGDADVEGRRRALPPREAIAEAVRTRVRPIFMGTLTSVGGMAPLVFMPGSGSELYRGLGSVVVGGLLVSTIFTILLVPLLLSLLCDIQVALGRLPEARRQTRPTLAARPSGVSAA